MTHKDIYTKFMIEYDKANVTSSYPSLTEYEVATVLDKAYNALIAQKVTGNNVRRSTFESDIKAIADLAPLVVTDTVLMNYDKNLAHAANEYMADVPEDMLYFLQASLTYSNNEAQKNEFNKYGDDAKYNPWDSKTLRTLPVKLVNHEIAQKFFSSAFNMPWIKQPVCFIEGEKLFFIVDPIDRPDADSEDVTITYIKKPNLFVKDMDKIQNDYGAYANTFTYFDFQKSPARMSQNPNTAKKMWEELDNMYTFECNDTVAEELISLAITFALENIESSRLNAKLNMRGLEA